MRAGPPRAAFKSRVFGAAGAGSRGTRLAPGQTVTARILVPLDGTRSAERALPVAIDIARRSGSALHLVRIHVRPERPPLSLEGMPVVDQEADARCWAAEREYLIRIREKLGQRSKLPTRIAVMDGPVEMVLATYVSWHGVDLIVMATHARRGLARAWLGSVGDALLRVSGAPVLLVRSARETAWQAAEQARPRILIPLDGSTLSERVVEPAVELGRALQATFTLLRVVNPVGVLGDLPVAVAPGMGMATAARRESEARDYLSQIGWWMQERGLDVDTAVVSSEHPAEAILQESERVGASMIAMATHGRHGLSRLVMGSVAGAVLREAGVPLLLYRPGMVERGLGLRAAAVAGANG
jgi:nucleotide-binding universal stress UspA family protein